MFPDMICPCYLQDIYKDMYTSVTYRELFMFPNMFCPCDLQNNFPTFFIYTYFPNGSIANK